MKQNLKKLLVTVSLLFCVFSNAQMILEYNILTANTQVGIPLTGQTTNVTVNWGDGSAVETVISSQIKRHTYATVGTKTITITGSLTHFGNTFTLDVLPTDSPDRLIRVVSWDNLGLVSLSFGLENCTNLIDLPSTLPSTITNISYLLTNDTNFNDNISTWNVSNVLNMDGMFQNAINFEQNIGSWNVVNVFSMRNMFYNVKLCTENYDAILNSWSTQNVRTNIEFSGGLSKYSAASSAARSSLITNKSWVITDAGVATASDFCNLSNDSYEKEVFTIFPNPANNVLNINTDNQTLKLVSYEIYTLTGQRIQKNNFETLDNKINIENLANGNYLLKLYADKNSISKIFIKQ